MYIIVCYSIWETFVFGKRGSASFQAYAVGNRGEAPQSPPGLRERARAGEPVVTGSPPICLWQSGGAGAVGVGNVQAACRQALHVGGSASGLLTEPTGSLADWSSVAIGSTSR